MWSYLRVFAQQVPDDRADKVCWPARGTIGPLLLLVVMCVALGRDRRAKRCKLTLEDSISNWVNGQGAKHPVICSYSRTKDMLMDDSIMSMSVIKREGTNIFVCKYGIHQFLRGKKAANHMKGTFLGHRHHEVYHHLS